MHVPSFAALQTSAQDCWLCSTILAKVSKPVEGFDSVSRVGIEWPITYAIEIRYRAAVLVIRDAQLIQVGRFNNVRILTNRGELFVVVDLFSKY